MESRPASVDDLPVLTELYRRWDLAFVGAAEHDADEVAETFGDADTLTERSRLLVDGEQVLAAAWYSPAETIVLVDPDADTAALLADLVGWLAARGAHADALASDEGLRAALAAGGWTHSRSSFELIRAVSDDWTLAEPTWPDGIEIGDFRDADLEEVHRLIYVDAGWAEVPGHPDRDFAAWSSIFVTDKEDPAEQIVARRGARVVGVATGRIFSDGAGWVMQLAVAKPERGHGLGRALLLAALHRRVAAGATLLGLSVEARNASALALYESVGLRIDREWQRFEPPAL